MCFCAPASFIAGGGIAGVSAVIKPKKIKPRNRMLFSIPFIFSLHQILEGFVWLTFGSVFQIYFAYAFVIIAFLLWPAYVPLAFYRQETNLDIRKKLRNFILPGFLVSGYLAYFMLQNQLHYEIQGWHIEYFYDVYGEQIVMALYFLLTVLPPMLSSGKILKLFGVMLSLAYFVSFFFFYSGLFSVWCFFAAIMSLLIIFHLRQE
ncbi:hypothetical protein IT411_03195 [Candidatus Peregrinibacteria bacterium]|nr:hypothetical protein [Candidatus Peregrinibacteria bacterium]